jgi:hypothetical protein
MTENKKPTNKEAIKQILEWTEDDYFFYFYDFFCRTDPLYDLCEKYDILIGEFNMLNSERFREFIIDLFNVIENENYDYKYEFGENIKEFLIIRIYDKTGNEDKMNDEEIAKFHIFKLEYGDDEELEELWDNL